MSHVARPFLVVALSLSLSLFAFSQPPATEVIYGQTAVEWPAALPDAGSLLTVSGPGGLYLRQHQPAGNWPHFSLANEQGIPRPDGVYKWEVVLQAEWEGRVQSGWFQIQGGRVVAEGTGAEQPVFVEEGAPRNSIHVDQEGRVGIGTSVPAAQLHLKGTNPALALEDVQAGGHEYVLRSQEGGDGSFGLFDKTTGHSRWLVDAEGRMAINTTQPTSTLTVDGYIESTKGFLVNGRPIPLVAGFNGSLPLATEGTSNNFFGTGAGAANTALYNSFFGGHAGEANTSGNGNSFFGRTAGRNNTTASLNSFFGESAGYYNTTGQSNSFFGRAAGFGNTTGLENSFFGVASGFGNTTGNRNSFFGKGTGSNNTVENNNTLLGGDADLDPGAAPATQPVTNATAIGYRSWVSQSNSLVLGGVRGFNSVTTETFVGIGTPNPDRQLVVEGSQALGKFRRYSATTPTHSPAFLFERARGTNTAPSDILAGDYLGKVQFRGRVSGGMPEYGALAFIASDKAQNGRFSFIDRDLVTERMVVLNTGNVGIGTIAPTALLDVAGDLRVRGTILYGAPAAAPVPDYVFHPEYKLMPLPQLEQYLKTERHLPNVPNANEIQEKGVNLGDFQMKLLEKIEELTLYTVEQAKQIQEQQKTIQKLERQQEEITGLKAKLARLEALLEGR